MDTITELLARYHITSQQLDCAERVEDYAAHKVYYRLPSQTRVDHEHIVQWNPIRKRLECSCEAGQSGQTCWAMRAAVCHAEIVRLERIAECDRLMRELQAEIDADLSAMMARVAAATLQVATPAEIREMDSINASRTFSLLK